MRIPPFSIPSSHSFTRKPISEWIVSVGRHEDLSAPEMGGNAKYMLDEIAEKHNRPIENQCSAVRLNVLPYLRKTAACIAGI